MEDEYKEIIIESLNFLVRKNRVNVHAFVIMPNHIHLIWRIKGDLLLADVQRDFMKYTAQQFKFRLLDSNAKLLSEFRVNLKDREYQFWERNSLSIDLYSPAVLIQKLDYIHRNPIQKSWRLANDELGYWYTSARFYETGVDEFGFLTHYLD